MVSLTFYFNTTSKYDLHVFDSFVYFFFRSLESRSFSCKGDLYEAVVHGHFVCVELLVRAGADVNQPASDGHFPILSVHPWKSGIIFSSLLKQNPDLSVCVNGHTTLMTAAYCDVRNVHMMLDAGVPVNAVNFRNYTALVFASRDCKSECVKALIGAGADVNIMNDKLGTALMAAGESGYLGFYPAAEGVRCVRLLLNAGAQVNTWGISIPPAFKRMARLFIAAGQKHVMGEETEREKTFFRNLKGDGMCLKVMCRETIRNKLLEEDPHTNLFKRIPELKLPSILTEYLLYNQTLSEEANDSDSDDDDDEKDDTDDSSEYGSNKDDNNSNEDTDDNDDDDGSSDEDEDVMMWRMLTSARAAAALQFLSQ